MAPHPRSAKTTPRDHIEAKLRQESHDNVTRHLLHHGESFDAALRLPNDLPALPEAEAHSCYLNSYRLAAADPTRFIYYEGVGVIWQYDGNEATEQTLSGPLSHGWCVDRNGRVVDRTWTKFGESNEPAVYRGIPVPLPVAEPFAYSRSGGTFEGLRWDLSSFDPRFEKR